MRFQQKGTLLTTGQKSLDGRYFYRLGDCPLFSVSLFVWKLPEQNNISRIVPIHNHRFAGRVFSKRVLDSGRHYVSVFSHPLFCTNGDTECPFSDLLWVAEG